MHCSVDLRHSQLVRQPQNVDHIREVHYIRGPLSEAKAVTLTAFFDDDVASFYHSMQHITVQPAYLANG